MTSTASDTRIRLITDADDMGCCPSVNRAFYDAYKQGILRNGNFIVPGTAFEEAAEMFMDAKDFCLGLHGTVTCEWTTRRWKPLLPRGRAASFIEADGTMRFDTQVIQGRGPCFDEMLAEFQAQLDAARRRGLRIEYFSTHMNPRWLKETPNGPCFGDYLRPWIEREGLIGRYDYMHTPLVARGVPGGDRVAAVTAALGRVGPGLHTLLTHPAYDDAPMREMVYGDHERGEIARERDAQRRVLMDPAILRVCRERGIVPVRYSELADTDRVSRVAREAARERQEKPAAP